MSDIKILKKEQLLIIAVFLSFFLLRLYKLGFHDFWYDEMGTFDYAKYPWGHWNAPLYYILLHFWTKIFGFSEISLRFPSVIFNFLAIVFTYLLAKKLFTKKIAILASFFMGISPLQLWYAQEARDYSMVLFFATVSTYILFTALEKNKIKYWVYFLVVSIAGMYTSYFYIFLFFGQVIFLTVFKKSLFNFRAIASFLLILISFSLYLEQFLRKFFTVWQGFWIPKPDWQSLVITLENFTLGYNSPGFLYAFSTILICLCFFSVLRLWFKRRDLNNSIVFCATLFIVPIGLVFIFSKLFFSVYLDRGLIIFSPYFYIILAAGIFSINRYSKIIILPVFLTVLVISSYYYFNDFMFAPLKHHIGTYIKKPMKATVRFLDSNVQYDDIVAFTNPASVPFIFNYQKNRPKEYYYFFDPAIFDTRWQRAIAENKNRISLENINKLRAKKIWLISGDWPQNSLIDANSQSVKNYLDKNFKLKNSYEFGGLWVFQYEN